MRKPEEKRKDEKLTRRDSRMINWRTSGLQHIALDTHKYNNNLSKIYREELYWERKREKNKDLLYPNSKDP